MKPDLVALRLYESHRDSLVSYAGRLSGDTHAAEDIVQDAWLLFDRRQTGNDVREPLSYFKRIVRNLVFAQARRKRLEGAAGDLDAAEVAGRLVDDRPDVEAELIAREDVRIVMETLASLPERQQAAFKMYHFEGMKLREVGLRLGISTSLAHLLVTEAMQLCDEKRKWAAS